MDAGHAVLGLASISRSGPYLDISNKSCCQKIIVTGKKGKTSSAVQLKGTLPEVDKAPGDVLRQGRWFSAAENEAKANVCVIGDSVRDAYFPYGSPLGETISIGGEDYRVVGTLQKREQLFGGGGGDNAHSTVIYVPLSTALQIKPHAEDDLILSIAIDGRLAKAKEDVQATLRIHQRVKL